MRMKRKQLSGINYIYIYIYSFVIDPFHLSRCCTATTDQTTTKFYNSSKADVGGVVQTLTLCVLRSDWTDSVWMPTNLVKFLVHSIHLLRKKLRHLADCCCYFLSNVFSLWVSRFGVGGWWLLSTLAIQVRVIHLCVCVQCVCVQCVHARTGAHVCVHACMQATVSARVFVFQRVSISLCFA